jgi:hypothetical protein
MKPTFGKLAALAMPLAGRGKWYHNDTKLSNTGPSCCCERPPPRAYAPVAQRIEHQTSNLGVAGSSPAGRTNNFKRLPPRPEAGADPGYR